MYNNPFITNLQAQRASLVEQIHHIDAMLKLNGINVDEMDATFSDNSEASKMPYKKTDTWQVKFGMLIKTTNRFLSINEASNMVVGFEPKITLEEAKKGLGSAKNLLLKSGTIVKFQVGTNNSNSFYGKKDWINADGSIKEEHKYSEDAVQVKPLIEI